MRKTLAIAGSVVADAIRRKIVYVILLFAAIMAVAIPSLPSYGVGVDEAVFREVALALTYFTSMVVVLTLAANRIPSEVEHRTVFNIIVRNVARWQYVLGTWLGVLAVMAGTVAAFLVIVQIVAMWVYGQPMWQLWQGALSIWFEVGVVAAFAVAVSALVGPVTVSVASFAFLFLGHARGGLSSTLPPAVYRLYPSLDGFNIIAPVAHGAGVSPRYVALMTGSFLAWSAVLMLLGSAGFSRRDL